MRAVLAAAAISSLLTFSQVWAQERLEVLNRTSEPIAQLFFAPIGREVWGTNQIGEGQALKVGAKAPFAVDHRSGRYSVKIVHSSGRSCRIKSVVIGRNDLVTLDDLDLTDCSRAPVITN